MSFTESLTSITSDFTSRLTEVRRRVDDFATTNEKRADAVLADAKQTEIDEQRDIDLLLRQLKSLQSERGVVGESSSSEGNGGSGSSSSGVADQRKKLESKQVKLEEEVSMLKKKNRVEQAQLDGEYFSLHIICHP